MATLTLTAPVRVGDLMTGITVSSLTLVSISMNFQTSVVSVVLADPASGYSYPVTLTGTNAATALTALATAYPNLQKQILGYVSNLLPAGTVS
jgi:hypothetical protein